MDVVFFSSVSGNTKRFVEKLKANSLRIPLHKKDGDLEVSNDYILITPTYGGGGEPAAVPKQVIRFLNNSKNREHLQGIVSTGNKNFGRAYCLAGDIIQQKTGKPVLHQVEIFGTFEDVEEVQATIDKLQKDGDGIESK